MIQFPLPKHMSARLSEMALPKDVEPATTRAAAIVVASRAIAAIAPSVLYRPAGVSEAGVVTDWAAMASGGRGLLCDAVAYELSRRIALGEVKFEVRP